MLPMMWWWWWWWSNAQISRCKFTLKKRKYEKSVRDAESTYQLSICFSSPESLIVMVVVVYSDRLAIMKIVGVVGNLESSPVYCFM